jgi:hypothetical protein
MNTQLTLFPELPSDAKAPLPASPTSPFASAFDHFTLQQRKQIIAWNNKHTYDHTIDLIQKEFGITVSRSSLGRFQARTALIQHIEDTPDTQAAADEILLHITSSNPSHHKLTAASIEILEQTAFKLSLTCTQNPSHLDALNRISLILCRARNTRVRERHATVQETKCDLRREELALKTKLVNHRIAMDHAKLNRWSDDPADSFNPCGGTSPARSASQSTVLASESPTSTPAIQVDPIAQPSASSIPSTPDHGRDVFHETVSKRRRCQFAGRAILLRPAVDGRNRRWSFALVRVA